MPIFDPEQYAAAMPAADQPFYGNSYTADAQLAEATRLYYKQLEDAAAANAAYMQKLREQQAVEDAAVAPAAETADTPPPTAGEVPAAKPNPLGRNKDQQKLDKAKADAAQSNFAKTWLPTQTVEPGVTNIEQFYELPYSRREALVNARVDSFAAQNKMKPDDTEKLRAESMKTITYVDNGGKPLDWKDTAAALLPGSDMLDTAVTALGGRIGDTLRGYGLYTGGTGAAGKVVKNKTDWSDAYSAYHQDVLRQKKYQERIDEAARNASGAEGFAKEVRGAWDSAVNAGREVLAAPFAKASELLASQAPELAGGAAAGAAAKRALTRVVSEVGPRVLPRWVKVLGAGGASIAGYMGVGGLMGAEKASAQADAMVADPEEVWRQNPEYLPLAEKLGNSDAAKQIIANRTVSTPARMAANAATGALAAGSDALLGGFAGFKGVTLGGGSASNTRKALVGVGKEQVTEQPFALLDQYQQNTARQTNDPSIPSTDKFGSVVGDTAVNTLAFTAGGALHQRYAPAPTTEPEIPVPTAAVPTPDPATQNVAVGTTQVPPANQPDNPPPTTKTPLSDAELKAEVATRVQEREHATPEEIIASAVSPLTEAQINAVRQASAKVDALSELQLNAMGISTKPTAAQRVEIENTIRKEYGMPEIKAPPLQAAPIVASETRPDTDTTGMSSRYATPYDTQRYADIAAHLARTEQRAEIRRGLSIPAADPQWPGDGQHDPFWLARNTFDSNLTRMPSEFLEEAVSRLSPAARAVYDTEIVREQAEFERLQMLKQQDIVASTTRPNIDTTGMTRDQIVQAHAMNAFSELTRPSASVARDTPKEYDAVRRTPMPDAANAAAARGAAADMFSAIGDDVSLPKFQRGIAKHIAPMMAEVQLQIENDTMYHETGAIESGSYNPALRRIRLARDGGLNVETAIHEGMHATTIHVMRLAAKFLSPRQRQGVKEINEVYAHLKTLPAFENEYAGINSEEMVSEAFSNALVREKMKAVPWKSKSAWTSLTTAIRDALGLPTSIPENALDAIIRASEAVVSAPTAFGGQAASAVRRPLPAGYEEKPKKEAKPKEEPHPKDRRLFVSLDADGAGTYRGSAIYDPETRTWDAVYYGADETGAPRTFARTLANETQATQWLQKFGGTVRLSEQAEKVTGNIKGFLDQAEILTPGARKFYTALSTLPVLKSMPESVRMGLTRGLSSEFVQRVTRAGVSRYAAMDKLQRLDPTKASSPLGLGANRVGLQKANAVGERTMPGFNEKSWYDYTQDISTHVDQMKAMGIKDATISDFVYAVTAQGRNRINKGKLPTDIAGREKSQDYARFSYYEDGAGNIINAPAGAARPLGAKVVDGLEAPDKFIAQFAKQFPDAVPVADAFLNTWKAGNERLINLRLANGSITSAEAKAQRAEPYFAPLRQPTKNVRARTGSVGGRATKAMDPLQQWLAVGDARVEAAFASGIIKDIYTALLENPNPLLATISAVDAKLEPALARDSNEDDDAPESKVKWVHRDWRGEDSVLIRDGNNVYKITFTDKNIAASLRAATTPDEMAAVRNALQLSTRLLTLTRTGIDPGFWLKQLPWDPVMVFLNTQGAYGRDASGRHNVSVKESSKLMTAIITKAYGELAQSAKSNYKVGLGTLDPMRTYYNSKGGGIAFASTVGLDASTSMLSTTPRSVMGKVVSGASTAVDKVSTVGHLMSDALRYQTFKSYITMRNGGKELKTASEISSFMKEHPDAEAIALQASKDILGNFEHMGQNVWLRAIFPYFNAALVGTTQVLPQVLGSRHGQVATTLLTGTVFFAALAAMGSDDDETDDGRSKYLDSAKAWTGIAVDGGTHVIPLPPEMVLPIAAANLMAASYVGKGYNVKAYQGKAMEAFMSLLPIKPAPGDNAPWHTAFGAVSYPILAYEERDQFGRPLANPQPSEKQIVDAEGNKLDVASGRLEPDYMRGTQRDPAWAINAAKGIYDLTGGGVDALPGTYRLWAEAFSGGLMTYATAYQTAELEGGDGTKAAFVNLAKGYAVKPNPYAVKQRYDRASADVVEANALLVREGGTINPEGQLLQGTNTELKALRSPLGLTRAKANKALLDAKVAGDSARYQEAKAEMDELNKQSSIIMGRTTKMLE